MANLYFLILLILETIPTITSDGRVPPVLVWPLSFVVGLSMIKDAFEDYLRAKSDNDENNRSVLALPFDTK